MVVSPNENHRASTDGGVPGVHPALGRDPGGTRHWPSPCSSSKTPWTARCSPSVREGGTTFRNLEGGVDAYWSHVSPLPCFEAPWLVIWHMEAVAHDGNNRRNLPPSCRAPLGATSTPSCTWRCTGSRTRTPRWTPCAHGPPGTSSERGGGGRGGVSPYHAPPAFLLRPSPPCSFGIRHSFVYHVCHHRASVKAPPSLFQGGRAAT